MKAKRNALAAAVMVAALGAAGPALGTDDMTSLPPPKVQGAVSFITGGIGEDEAAAFKRAAAAYPLELLFVEKARPRDEFLADVRVSVRNKSGTVLLETTAEGPYLLANLPAGKYAIEAEFRGDRKHRSVEIRSGAHQRAVFVWAPRDNDEQAAVVSSSN